MNIRFRIAIPQDAAELKRLNDAFNGPDCNTPEGILQGIVRADAETVFVAQAENCLAGFLCAQLLKSVCYRSFYVEITELYVQQEYRRQGVGRALMGFAQDYFRQQGIHDFQLFTGGENAAAQQFYEKMGYQRENDVLYRLRDKWNPIEK